MSLAQHLWHMHRRNTTRLVQEGKLSNIFHMSSRLVFIVTTRCNFTCQHCLRTLEKPKDLPLETAQKALAGGKKYNLGSVVFTGGEPFLYPEREALTAHAVGLGYRVGFVTNGYNLQEHADFLHKYKKSIAFIAFSLESADPKEHDTLRHKGSFERVIAGFELCRKEKIPFRCQTAVSRRNKKDLLPLILLAKKKRVSGISFTTMLQCPRTEHNDLILSAKERQELIYDLLTLKHMFRTDLNIAADIHAFTNIHLCQPMQMKEIAFDAEGRLVQCCELANFDDAQIRNFTTIADLRTDTFDETMKKLSAHIHRFNCMRIDDFARLEKRDNGPDFSSCFYCIRKITAQPETST